MTSAILDHLWQSTLCVAVAWLLTLALRNNPARVRYWVWLAASIKFLIPFSVLSMMGRQFSWQSSVPSSDTPAFVDIVQQFTEPLATPQIVLREPAMQTFDLMWVAISVWAIGSFLLLLRWAVSWWHITSAVRKAEPMQLQAPIVVKSTPVMHEPGVVGVVSPVLLLPHGIATRLSEAQMQAVIAHELCHVRRRDNLTAAIHMLVEALFWFHPLVWWIGSRLVEERERACDEAVVELGNEPQTYAEGILKVCQFYMESKLACVAGVSGANLKQRVEGIMSNRTIAGLNLGKKMLLSTTAGAAFCAPLFVGLLTVSEIQAQSDNRTANQTAAQTGGGADATFDEVSIQLGGSGPGDNRAFVLRQDGNYIAKNLPLRDIIASAYGTHKARVFGGPEWVHSLKFVVEGKSNAVQKATGKVEAVPYNDMVQAVLADRFRVRLHRETREVPVFLLKVANQSAMEAAIVPIPPPPPDIPDWMKHGSSITPDRTGLAFRNAQILTLVGFLSDRMGRPVVDRTHLTGVYNFVLAGKNILRLDQPVELVPAAVEQQLGLKLEAAMAPMEVLVIDDAQQPLLSAAVAAQPATTTPTSSPAHSSTAKVPVAAIAPTSESAKPELINLRFSEIEIRQVIDVLARVSGRSIELDPAVTGPLTIQLNGVSLDAALQEIALIRSLSIRIDRDVVRLKPLPTPAPSPSADKTASRPTSRIDRWPAVPVSANVVPAVAKLNATPFDKSQKMRGSLNLYFDNDTFGAENVTLRDLIRAAYGHLPEEISGGPEWLDRSRFDVSIKLGSPMRLPDIADGPSREFQLASWQTMQVRQELRDLLAERFRLTVRSEKKNAAYKLVVVAGGAKLRQATAGIPTAVQVDEIGRRITAANTSTQELSSLLSKYLSRPVLNRTSLSERYDFDLRMPAGHLPSDASRLSESLSAQLGLELQQMPIDTLVIVRAEKLKDVI